MFNKKLEEKIALAGSPHSCDNLDHAVPFTGNQLLNVAVSLNPHIDFSFGMPIFLSAHIIS